MSDRSQPSELLKLAEQIKRTEQAFRKIGSWDTWTLTIDIAGFLDGELGDWPRHIQDGIYRAVEQQCIPKPGERVEVVVAKCYHDDASEPAYLRIVVQAFPITIN